MQRLIHILFICILPFCLTAQNEKVIDFSIKDISTVDKVVLSNKQNQSITFIKKENLWRDMHHDCVNQERVHLMLETIKNISFQGYLSENTVKVYTEQNAFDQIKVEIYQHGKWSKTWYIGPPTHDHMGQIISLESSQSTEKSFPAITKMKGLVGIISPRFPVDPKNWRCTTIFKISPEEITSVHVTNFENENKSFHIDVLHNDLRVYQNDHRLNITDTSAVYHYLNQFKKIHFERFDSEASKSDIERLTASAPFVKIEIMKKNGFSKTILCYRKPDKHNPNNIDLDQFWCILPPSGELVVCQYFVFNALIHGEHYFPITNSGEE